MDIRCLVRGPGGSAVCSVPIIAIDNYSVRVVRKREDTQRRRGQRRSSARVRSGEGGRGAARGYR